MRTILFTVLLGVALATVGCQHPQEKIVIFHAGSLAMPLKAAADSFCLQHPNVQIITEASGSMDCARKITELGRACDILASADYTVIDNLLIPEYTQTNIPFAGNELALVYTSASKYADSINAQNWPYLLAQDDVFFGRSDPNADPCGYRTLLCWQLAATYYTTPAFPLAALLEKDTRFIRPKEVDLIALLEAHAIDYMFIYKSVAIQHQLPYVALPKEINLSDPALADAYAQAKVTIRGKKPGDSLEVKGTPMVYSLTIPFCAENPKTAQAFVDYLLDPNGGQRILAAMGQTVFPAP